jgi:hypothetical protein
MWFCSLNWKNVGRLFLSPIWGQNKARTGGIPLIATALWLHPLLVHYIPI